MKFTVSQSSLTRALLVVAKGMATNTTMPYLAGIYIKAENGTLEFQTTNLSISIRHRIAANVEEPGETVVSGKVLTSVAKTLPDAAVSFSMDPGAHMLQVVCNKSRYRLNTLDAADFPEFPEVAVSRSIELPSALLQDMVDRVYRVTSKDTSRPILQGVLLSVEENTIRMVATDSSRHDRAHSGGHHREPGGLLLRQHHLHQPPDRGELPQLPPAPPHFLCHRGAA